MPLKVARAVSLKTRVAFPPRPPYTARLMPARAARQESPNALPARFRKHLLEDAVLPKGGSVIVGVSGRRDSVALLHLLHEIADDLDLHLIVAHVQYGEGGAHDADAAFVREAAKTFNIPLDLFIEDQPASDLRRRKDERRRYFVHVRTRLGATAIATGETLDDAAEEFLATLVSDHGPPLSGSPAEDVFARPLLPFSREECRAFLKDRGISFRPDPDALSLDTKEKKLRLLIVPLLRRHVESAVLQNVAAAASLTADSELFLARLVSAARSEVDWHARDGTVSVNHRQWSALPVVLRRGLLSDISQTISPTDPLARSALLELDQRCRHLADGATTALGGLNASRSHGTLRLTRNHHASVSHPAT